MKHQTFMGLILHNLKVRIKWVTENITSINEIYISSYETFQTIYQSKKQVNKQANNPKM